MRRPRRPYGPGEQVGRLRRRAVRTVPSLNRWRPAIPVRWMRFDAPPGPRIAVGSCDGPSLDAVQTAPDGRPWPIGALPRPADESSGNFRRQSWVQAARQNLIHRTGMAGRQRISEGTCAPRGAAACHLLPRTRYVASGRTHQSLHPFEVVIDGFVPRIAAQLPAATPNSRPPRRAPFPVIVGSALEPSRSRPITA